MVDPPTLQPPRSVAEALETGSIPAELAAILAAQLRTVLKDGAALLAEKRLCQGIHSFLALLASGLYSVPGLERLTLVEVDSDRIAHLMHLILSVWVDIYSTSRRFFSAWASCPPRPPHQWWRSPTRPSRRGAPFVTCRKWNMSHTLGGSSLPIGRQIHVRGRGIQQARTLSTWLDGG